MKMEHPSLKWGKSNENQDNNMINPYNSIYLLMMNLLGRHVKSYCSYF